MSIDDTKRILATGAKGDPMNPAAKTSTSAEEADVPAVSEARIQIDPAEEFVL